jgi:hypothetical protein
MLDLPDLGRAVAFDLAVTAAGSSGSVSGSLGT